MDECHAEVSLLAYLHESVAKYAEHPHDHQNEYDCRGAIMALALLEGFYTLSHQAKYYYHAGVVGRAVVTVNSASKARGMPPSEITGPSNNSLALQASFTGSTSRT